MSDIVNRVRVLAPSATGTSTAALGSAYSSRYLTPAEAGCIDGRRYTWLIEQGNDVEVVQGAWTSIGNTAARTKVIFSKIAGSVGSSKINLNGTAVISIVQAAEDMGAFRGSRIVTASSDAILASDLNRAVIFNRSTAMAVSIGQAGDTGAFIEGWLTWVQNKGAGAVTITPATSTIDDGAATLVLQRNQSALVWSDGSNYQVMRLAAAGREVLVSNRTYYIRADGSDNNNGLANSSGGAFATFAKAVNAYAMLDTNTFDVILQAQDATWTENIAPKSVTGGGRVIFRGNITTPANCVLNSTTGRIIDFTGAVGRFKLEGFKSTSSGGGGYHIVMRGAGLIVELGVWDFGASAAGHWQCNNNAEFNSTTNYTISASASFHGYGSGGGLVTFNMSQVNITNTPAWGNSFVRAESGAFIAYGAPVFNGSATGVRFGVAAGGIVAAYGATLPGSIAGDSTGGYYI